MAREVGEMVALSLPPQVTGGEGTAAGVTSLRGQRAEAFCGGVKRPQDLGRGSELGPGAWPWPGGWPDGWVSGWVARPLGSAVPVLPEAT